MPKFVRRGRDFWGALVEEFEAGGAVEEHRAFADRHHVKCDTFRRWLYLLRAERGGRPWRTSRGVPRKSAPSIAWPLVEVQAGAAADGRFEIELPGGRRLRVPAAFDADALRRLLAIFDEKPSA